MRFVKLSWMYSTCNYTRYSNRLLLCWCIYIALLNDSLVFYMHHMVIIQQQMSHLSSGVTTGATYTWASPQYLCSMPSKMEFNVPIKCCISCNDISFNFNCVMVVMYRTSPEPVCTVKLTFLVKQFSHQTHQHEKAPEFHRILVECCIFEIRML